jgi:hypothetical protein
MNVRLFSVCAVAGLAGWVAGGCADHQPAYAYIPPPPVAGTVGTGRGLNYTPAVPAQGAYVPAPAPAPGAVQEPPPGATVIVSQPPPAPQAEITPPAPGPDYVWTPGYYDWNGFAWVWAPGVWVRPPYRGALWFGGHWDYRGGRSVWVRGRWR